MKSKLTLGPLFYHWPPEKRRDFYFRVADEMDVDCVYLGEVVCSKREGFFDDYRQQVTDRLKAAGKEVVLSTLALVTTEKEIERIKAAAASGFLVEANDVATVNVLMDRPFVVGPFINVMNEGTRDYLVRKGAARIVFPMELPGKSIALLAGEVETEVQVFGRQPLSVAMRCYHARSKGLHKDGCRISCMADPDGLIAETVDGQNILAINGTQTLSHGYVVLLRELAGMQAGGVTHFRLSPQDVDMVKVASIYRDVMDNKKEAKVAEEELVKITENVPFINGFFHAREGMAWVEEP